MTMADKPEKPFNIRIRFTAQNTIAGYAGYCPKCYRPVDDRQDARECRYCGQKLDWD